MIIAEHWINDENGFVSTLIPKEEPHPDDLGIKCCDIVGKDWDECVKKYDEHMGF